VIQNTGFRGLYEIRRGWHGRLHAVHSPIQAACLLPFNNLPSKSWGAWQN